MNARTSDGLRDALRRLRNPVVGGSLVLALLFVGLIVDLTTSQTLVVSILYNVPIVVAGVLLSQRMTTLTIALALLANLAAGFENAQVVGAYDAQTVANRALAAFTYLLVGGMSLLFEARSDEVTELVDVEEHSERERDLRHMLNRLSGPMVPDELAAAAADELRELLGAHAVVVTGLDGERFAAPRWASPAWSSLAESGKLAGWAVDSLPLTATPVITVREEDGILSVGRWRCPAGPGLPVDDLIIVAARPSVRKASELLGEALGGLSPLLARAHELAELREAAGR